MGLDAEGIKEAPRDLAVEYLIENNIEIIEHVGLDALEVRVDGEVIGEWATPELKLKIDKADELYFEINIEHWSIIEEDIEEYEER
jgi:hypothetical protein